jgi:UDPglucose 6-dehydrogenase
LEQEWHGSFTGKTVAFWGLSFKPRTDDVREAPALYLAEALLERGGHVRVFDPVAMKDFQKAFPDERVTYGEKALDILSGADALIVVTEWDEFRSIDPSLIREHLTGDLVIDGRNIFEEEEVTRAGLRYRGIGV